MRPQDWTGAILVAIALTPMLIALFVLGFSGDSGERDFEPAINDRDRPVNDRDEQ